MTRANTTKLYRTFTKGLITEAGFLTYPDDASTDELNTVLHRQGNRSRRLGIDYEEGSIECTIPEANTITEYHWRAVNNNADLNFLCLQVGFTILFFDTTQFPIGSHKKSFSIDLTGHKTAAATFDQALNSRVQMVSGKGFLFVVGEFYEPFLVEYDSVADNINVTTVNILVRDFDGVNDNLHNEEEPSSLTKEHQYNLKNQGWLAPGDTQIGTVGPSVDPSPPPSTVPGKGYNPWTGGTYTGTSIP